MVLYTCERCGIFSTNIRSHYVRHLNRKKPCKALKKDVSIATLKSKIVYGNAKLTPIDSGLTPIDSGLTPIDSELTPIDSGLTPIDSDLTPNIQKSKIHKYQCEFCEKILSKSSNLHRHYKRCKAKQDHKLIEHMSKQIENLEAEKEKMRKLHEKEVKTLLTKVGNVTHITNNQQNVYINNYGQENLSYINSNYLSNLLKIPYGAVPKLLKDIHFHPEHPENMNIKITNKKLPYVSVFKGDKWELKDKREIIENMVDKGFNILDNQYELDKEGLSLNQVDRYQNFQELYNSDDKVLKKKLVKSAELTILNQTSQKI